MVILCSFVHAAFPAYDIASLQAFAVFGAAVTAGATLTHERFVVVFGVVVGHGSRHTGKPSRPKGFFLFKFPGSIDVVGSGGSATTAAETLACDFVIGGKGGCEST